jgi:hypothetical protein
MYIIGTSKSPISLLEMGIHIKDSKLIVVCEPEFYRYENVKKFLLSDLKFKEAEKYFTEKGIEYRIITEDDINIKLAQKYIK